MNSKLSKFVAAIWFLFSLGLGFLILFSAPDDRNVALRTLGLGLGAAAIAVPIGSLLAWISLGRNWMSHLVLLTTISLLMIPVFLQVSAWDAAFGRLGWLTSNEGQVLVPLVSGWQAAIWIHGVAAAPQVAVLMLVGQLTGRRTFEEQALLDTSRWGVFINVTLRRMWPLLIASTLWTIVLCSREIAVTDLYRIGTVAEQIYLGYSLGQFNALAGNWSQADLVAAGNLNPWVTVILTGWVSLSIGYVILRFTDMEIHSENWRPLERQPIGKWTANSLGALLLLVLAVVPATNLLIRCAYYVRPVEGVPTPGYSVGQLGTTLRRASLDYTDEFGWSLVIGAAAASLVVMLAIVVAWLARRSTTWQLILVFSIAISCAVPGPLMGSLINRLFSMSDLSTVVWIYDRTIVPPVLASGWFFWPIGALLISFLFRKVPRDSLESSNLEGAGKFAQFIQIGLRSNAAALTGCWLVTFTLCFGELSASQLVLPPGMDTLPRLMLGLLHAGVDEMTAALTIVTSTVLIAISSIAWKILRLNSLPSGRK